MASPATKMLLGGGGASSGLPVTSSLFAWYDASVASSITSSGGNVSQWNDLSGNGYHLTSSGGNRPITGSRTMNSLNVLDFQGGQFMRYTSSPAFATSGFSFMIVTGTDSESGGGRGFVVIHDATGNDYDTGNAWAFTSGDFSTVARIELGSSTCVISGAGNTPIGTWVGVRNTLTGGTDILSPSSTTNPTTFSSTGTATGGILIGTRWVGGATSSNYLDGPIAEIVIWSAYLSTTDRTTMHNYGVAKWGA